MSRGPKALKQPAPITQLEEPEPVLALPGGEGRRVTRSMTNTSCLSHRLPPQQNLISTQSAKPSKKRKRPEYSAAKRKPQKEPAKKPSKTRKDGGDSKAKPKKRNRSGEDCKSAKRKVQINTEANQVYQVANES